MGGAVYKAHPIADDSGTAFMHSAWFHAVAANAKVQVDVDNAVTAVDKDDADADASLLTSHSAN